MPTTETNPDNSLLTRLHELEQETDPEFVIELIDIFMQESPLQIQTIAKALNTQDHSSLTVAAHTLKGSSLNLGAKQLGAHCFKLEDLGRSGKPIPTNTNTKDIEEEFEKVKAMLLNFKQSKQK